MAVSSTSSCDILANKFYSDRKPQNSCANRSTIRRRSRCSAEDVQLYDKLGSSSHSVWHSKSLSALRKVFLVLPICTTILSVCRPWLRCISGSKRNTKQYINANHARRTSNELSMCPLNITIEPAEHDEYGSDHEQSSSGDPRDPRHDWSTYTTDRRYWEEHRPARDSIAGRPVTVPRGSDRRVDIKVVENLEECLEDGWLLKAQPAETQRSRRDSHERVKPPLGLNPWNNTLKPYNRFEGGRCKNDVNGLPCWESTMKTDIVLRSRIEALLASEHSRLFAKRYPLISYGIFLLGSRSDARPSIVISVRDDQVCKKLQKILK